MCVSGFIVQETIESFQIILMKQAAWFQIPELKNWYCHAFSRLFG